MKFSKISFICFIFLIDLIIFPMIIVGIDLLIKNQITIGALPDYYMTHINPVHYYKHLITTKPLFNMFLLMQVLPLILFVHIYWRTNNMKFTHSGKKGTAPKSSGNGEFGTARWQELKELNITTKLWNFFQEDLPGGIIVGSQIAKKFVYTIVDDLHTMIIGSTRSGKTRKWLFPTLWRLSFSGESMLFTDPKGEIYEKSHAYLERKGYETVVIDFRQPGWGNHWNLMNNVIEAIEDDNIPLAVQYAGSTAHMIVHSNPDSKKGEQTWNNGAESVIQALILVIAIEAPERNQKHMTSVYKLLGELGEPIEVIIGNQVKEIIPLNLYMKNLDKDHPARDAFISARLAPEKMRGSFYSSVATLLKNFADPAMQYLTSFQDHTLKNIGINKRATYLIIPDEDTTRHVLATLYIEQTYQELVKLANEHGGRIPNRVNMILDEFGNMPPFKDFPTKLTVSGGRGIRWHIIVQDFQQLEALYGNDADTIKGNCHTWIYILTASTKTAEEISKKLGEYTIKSRGASATESKSSSNSQSLSLSKRRLMTADEIEKLPDGQAIVIRLRNNPARVDLPDMSQYPCADDLRGGEEKKQRKIHKVNIFIPNLNEKEEQEIENPVEDQRSHAVMIPQEETETQDQKNEKVESEEDKFIFES